MSGKVCCVPGCSSSLATRDILHKFPNPEKELDRFNTWLHSIGGSIAYLSNEHIYKHRRICDKHFEEDYWNRNDSRISNTAVPTKNMPGLPLPQEKWSEKEDLTTNQCDEIEDIVSEDVPDPIYMETVVTTPAYVIHSRNTEDFERKKNNTIQSFEVCRVCLTTDSKMVNIVEKDVDRFKETLGFVVHDDDGLPQYLCVYCRALLLKFYEFKTQVKWVQSMLYGMMEEIEKPFTPNHIKVLQKKIKPKYVTKKLDYSAINIVPKNAQKSKLTNMSRNRIINFQFLKKDRDEPEVVDLELKENDSESSNDEDEDLERPKTWVEHEYDKIEDLNTLLEYEQEPQDGNTDHEDPNRNDNDDVNRNDNDNVNRNDNDDASRNNNGVNGINVRKAKNELDDNVEVKFLTLQEQMEDVLARKMSVNYKSAAFRCEDCFKGFLKEESFKNHRVMHDPTSGSHMCSFCKTRWPTYFNLRNHMVSVHERRYKCKTCGHVSTTSQGSRYHQKWHKGVKYTCQKCGMTFHKLTSYLSHARIRHRTQYVCVVCDEAFLGEYGLKAHMKRAHKLRPDTVTPNELLATVAKYCSECNIRFKSNVALKRHIATSSIHTADGANIDKHCRLCGESFGTSETYKEHARAHKRVKCKECEAVFANGGAASNHYKRMHLAECRHQSLKRFICEVCGLAVRSQAVLNYHQRRHTGEKPYRCQHCDKCFRLPHQMQCHMRTHTNERPYKCPQCSKGFIRKAALNRHIRVHTGERPYVCTLCGKSFSQSNSMKMHTQTVHFKMPYPYKKKSRKSNSVDQLKMLVDQAVNDGE